MHTSTRTDPHAGTDTDPESASDGDCEPESGSVSHTPRSSTIEDADAEIDRIASFLRDAVADADADGVVINMSGGLDSTVTAALAVEALGPERVYGLILPCNKIGALHARDAEGLADALGIEHDTIHIQPLFAAFGSVAPDRFDLHDEPVLTGNAIARLRMTIAYLAANATDCLVCGTTNRSERLLGYTTKHGDGAADILPIGDLYKTEVRVLAAALDVPEFVVEKPPTAGFLPGQRDVDDLGAPYEVIDAVLRAAVDEGVGNAATDADADPVAIAERVASRADALDGSDTSPDPELVVRLLERYRSTAHKRRTPPTPGRPDGMGGE